MRISSNLRSRFHVAMMAFFTGCFVFNAHQLANAQLVDVAKQARESQEQLAAEVANVGATAFRAKLQNFSEDQRLKRWYRGEVQFNDKWQTLAAVEQQIANNDQLAEYRLRRNQMIDRLVEHELMAKWCQKQGFHELARLHWYYVLRFAPQHRAALSELELSWHDGLLLTVDEAKRYQQQQREWLKQKKSWQAKIKRLRREIEKGPQEAEIAARKELRNIHEPAAVPALLAEFAAEGDTQEQTTTRHLDLLSILGGIEAPVAIEWLVRFAVLSDSVEVRYAAIDQLKSRPLQTYVPALIAELAMPIESSVSINNVGNRVVSSYTYAQEKPGGQEYTQSRQTYKTVPGRRYIPTQLYRKGEYVPQRTIPGRSQLVPINPGHGLGWSTREVQAICTNGNPYTYTRRTFGYGREYLKEVKSKDRTVGGYHQMIAGRIGFIEDPAFIARQQAVRNNLQQQARQDQQAVAQRNQAIQFQNERITEVLTEVTGETLTAFPKSWWNWWSNYLDQHPDAATSGTRQQLNAALMNQQQRGLAKGSWVWTRRGKQPIETILPGDYVLAQNPRSGELAFKVVLAVSAPIEMPVSKVKLNDSELHCAAGQVLWNAGKGWQRVSNLQYGQLLHGATAEARIQGVEKAFEITCYDLIVDDFHTYFVGEQGTLLHDATPIRPAYVAMPGFSPADVADVVRLAEAP